jgi:ferritin-like metal-binding protein YciE
MAEVEDGTALFLMAVRDLYDAEGAMAGRLPAVRRTANDADLVAVIAEDGTRSERQRESLAAIARSLGEIPGGQTNIWLRAILDDADNDASTIAAGPLRDIALTGAFRKAKQAERVSYETAIALAHALGLDGPAATLQAIRDEEAAADEQLTRCLDRLCRELPLAG